MKFNFAIVVPMANESESFIPFISLLSETITKLDSGRVYFVVDNSSIDNTPMLCEALSKKDNRFNTIWASDSRNVVDAYISGYREALKNNHEFIIEMDAGMSHDPRAIPMFLRVLNEGNECAFGSRFINGGSIYKSNWKRYFLSKSGTYLSNIFLGTKLNDATSGFQGFHADIARKIVNYELRSKAHFYQTEVRYLLRAARFAEVPIHYRAPSPSVSAKAVLNSIAVLGFYIVQRVRFRSPMIL